MRHRLTSRNRVKKLKFTLHVDATEQDSACQLRFGKILNVCYFFFFVKKFTPNLVTQRQDGCFFFLKNLQSKLSEDASIQGSSIPAV